jgi:hypothetical protein
VETITCMVLTTTWVIWNPSLRFWSRAVPISRICPHVRIKWGGCLHVGWRGSVIFVTCFRSNLSRRWLLWNLRWVARGYGVKYPCQVRCNGLLIRLLIATIATICVRYRRSMIFSVILLTLSMLMLNFGVICLLNIGLIRLQLLRNGLFCVRVGWCWWCN